MATQVTINDITGQTPYNIYVCQSDGTGCFYVTSTSSTPYVFNIPSPYDTSSSYMIKVIDGHNCVISGIQSVNPVC